jgi:hypothetical protein
MIDAEIIGQIALSDRHCAQTSLPARGARRSLICTLLRARLLEPISWNFNPKRDVSYLTARVCANILKEILGKMIAG